MERSGLSTGDLRNMRKSNIASFMEKNHCLDTWGNYQETENKIILNNLNYKLLHVGFSDIRMEKLLTSIKMLSSK